MQDKAPKEIHAILTETLGEHAPSFAVFKNWVAQFKHGHFSTCDLPRPGRPKTVTTPEIIDQIHKLILEDRRISAKSAIPYIRLSNLSFDSGISFILLAADWPNTSLQAAIKEGLMSSSPMEYGFFTYSYL